MTVSVGMLRAVKLTWLLPLLAFATATTPALAQFGASTAPTTPAESTAPTTPAESTAPTTPAESTAPTTPAEPAAPITPAAPAAPRAPAAPAAPTTPAAQMAPAESTAQKARPVPVNRAGVGILAAVGLHTGLALGTRLGLGDVGLELEGGYQLLIAVWHPPEDSNDGHADFGSSAQFGAELYYTPWHPTVRSAIGLKSGYRYNTELEHGFAVAITFLGALSPSVAFEGLAGAQVFPGSRKRLLRALGVPTDADIVYGSSAQVFEYGLQLIWYP